MERKSFFTRPQFLQCLAQSKTQLSPTSRQLTALLIYFLQRASKMFDASFTLPPAPLMEISQRCQRWKTCLPIHSLLTLSRSLLANTIVRCLLEYTDWKQFPCVTLTCL